MFKILVIVLLLAILYSLGSALFFMIRGGKDTTNVARALSWRIGLAFFLFGLIIVGILMGWIVPPGVPH